MLDALSKIKNDWHGLAIPMEMAEERLPIKKVKPRPQAGLVEINEGRQ